MFFYEFSMYSSSFNALLSVAICDETKLPDKQFWMNVLLESHATHLRNLIHFFSGKDSINEMPPRFIYYGQGTRNEYRITNFGRDFPFLTYEC